MSTSVHERALESESDDDVASSKERMKDSDTERNERTADKEG